MSEIDHYWGYDLSANSLGNLMTADGTLRNQQRIVRRLMTNPQVVNADGSITPADYPLHPNYGAGVSQYVGALFDAAKIRARIRGNMLLEDCVAKLPEPLVDVQQIPEGISCNITYNDAQTGTSQTLSFNVAN